MERLTAKHAWVAIGLGVLAWEMLCKEGELLSEGVDRALERSPVSRIATLGAIAVTSAHLANLLPDAVDPYHQAQRLLRSGK